MTLLRRAAAWAAALLLLGASLVAGGWVVWSSDRFLDVYDEGFFLLAARHPEDVLVWANAAHVYTARLFRLAGHDVVVFRLIGLVLLLASGHVLYVGFRRAVGAAVPGETWAAPTRVAVWSFLELGTLLFYVQMLRAPSYSLLNAVALNAGAGWLGIALAGLAGPPPAGRTRPAALVAVGLCAGLAFFVKFSTGISLLGLAAATLAACPGGRPRARALAPLLLGFAAWGVLHFALLQPPLAWWRMQRDGIELVRTLIPGHGPAALLRYLATLLDLVAQAWRLTWRVAAALVAGLVLLGVLRRRRLEIAAGPPLLLIAAFAWLARDCSGLRFHLAGGPFGQRFAEFYAAWVLLLLAALGASIAHRGGLGGLARPAGRRLLLLGACLLVLPVVGAVGTVDRITVVMMLHMGPVCALVLLLLGLLARLHRAPVVAACGVLVIGAFTTSQVAWRGLRHIPWGSAAPAVEQTVPTPVGVPPTWLRVDPLTSAALRELQGIALRCGFRPGDDILAFYNLPGLVFALGGRSPVAPWYVARGRNGRAQAERLLARIPPERLARAFLLVRPWPWMPVAPPDLARFGLGPDHWVRCGSVLVAGGAGRGRAAVHLLAPRPRAPAGSPAARDQRM